MEGPTSSSGSRNRLTCLTLQEHDDDDDDECEGYVTMCLTTVWEPMFLHCFFFWNAPNQAT